MSLTQYLLEFSICLALFYGLYHFLLRKETFFQLNRWYLLLSPALSMIIPFLNWDLSVRSGQDTWDGVIIPLVSDIQQQQTIIWENLGQTPAQAWSLTYLDLLMLLYMLGVVWMGYKLFLRTYGLLKIIGEGKRDSRSGYTLVNTHRDLPAASFLSYIFWEEGPLNPERKKILEHELVHVRQWHSLDVLLMEIWVMFKWFHPLIYWYRNSLRLTHEYIADAYVSNQSGSRSEYAQLLASSKSIEIQNHLLHQFNSSLKMRLLMLANRQSKRWKYLKYLLVVPVTATLLMLFSFNLAEDLPDPVVNSFGKAETILNDAVNQPVLTSNMPSTPAKQYALRWGELECNCTSEQYPNFYHCEDKNLSPKELRQLIRNEGGFRLFGEEEPQTISELMAVSKFMKDMGGFQGQFDEMGDDFNAASPLWEQIKKGDVFRFSFKNARNDYFEFELVVGKNRNATYALGEKIVVGEREFSLSSFDSNGEAYKRGAIVHLDVEEAQRLMNNPMQVRKSDGEFYTIKSATIYNRQGFRFESLENINSPEVYFNRTRSILESYPGDHISVRLTTVEEEDITFLVQARERSAWDGRKREAKLQWDKLTLDPHHSMVLSKEEIIRLADEDFFLWLNNEKFRIPLKFVPNGFFIPTKESEDVARKVNSAQIRSQLRDMKAGDWLHIGGRSMAEDLLVAGFRLTIDHDWQQILKGIPNVSFADYPGKIVMDKVRPEDVLTVLDLESNVLFGYDLEINGKYFGTGHNQNLGKLKKLVTEQNVPIRKLVLTRRK